MKIRSRVMLVFVALALLVSGMGPVSADQNRVIDVVEVTWPGARPASVSTANIEKAIANEVNPRWRAFTTLEGDTRARTLNFIHGQTLSQPIVLNRPMSCDGSSAGSFMSSIQIEAYKRLGISDWGSRYLIILAPDNDCIWMGRALIGSNEYPGGVMTLHDSASAFVIAHELGHTLGLGHSNFLRCDSGAKDGPWGSDCKAVEYGGTIDAMGNVDVSTPLSTYHQWRMGLLEESEIKQSWLNESIDLTASDVVGGTRVIFIRDGRATYWIEFRRHDANASYKPGLVIFRTDPPPASAIVSPNPEDTLLSEIPPTVGADIWMLNWDNYSYVRSRASGSMTLPQGETARVFSGNVSISASATSSPNVVRVNIARKADTTPPPVPVLTETSSWNYPGIEILRSGYDDGESAIGGFEIQIDGKEIVLPVKEVSNWKPTYLNPFTAPKTLQVRDLPEGNYSLSVRASDVWGNKSAWSRPVNAVIDRSDPELTTSVKITGVKDGNFDLSWSGISDRGSGICLTQISNQDDWVTYRSVAKSAPSLSIPTTGKLSGKLQVFDCLGNGKSAYLSIDSSFLSTANARRTGKWSAASDVAAGAMRCVGRCAAIFTTSGSVGVLAGNGTAQVVVSSKLVGTIPNSSINSLRVGTSVELGPKNRVVRVSGSNFTLVGIAKLNVTLERVAEIDRVPPIFDESLNDSTQRGLANFGFNQDDFTSDWTILPMARGTTLLDPTLDLCSANFTSEAGRQFRRQVTATKPGSQFAFLSTEVVKYRGKREADAALAELKSRYNECVSKKGGIESSGTFTPYAFTEISSSVTSRFSPASSVLVRAQIGAVESARQLLAFYQYSGDMFTGFYLVKNGTTGFTDAEVIRWSEVALTMKLRLERTTTS